MEVMAVLPPPPPPPHMRHPPVAQYQHPQPHYHAPQPQPHYPPQPTHMKTTTSSHNNTNNHAVHQQLLQAQGYTAAAAPMAPTPTHPLHAELLALTVGQMADLCALRQEAHQAAAQGDDPGVHSKGGTSWEPYTPLNNPIAAVMERPMMEAGRLDIRIHSLHDKLTKLKTGAPTR